MAKGNDYGYFGSGAEGYAHYKQTFDSTMKGSRSGGSGSSGSGRAPTMKEIEQMTPEEREKYNENLNASLKLAGVLLLIFVSLDLFLIFGLK